MNIIFYYLLINGELIYNLKINLKCFENSINLNSQWVNDYEETFESKLYKDFLKINREQNHLVNRFKNLMKSNLTLCKKKH